MKLTSGEQHRRLFAKLLEVTGNKFRPVIVNSFGTGEISCPVSLFHTIALRCQWSSAVIAPIITYRPT